MSEESLGIKAKEALRHIRNFIMLNGRLPSVRELMGAMGYKSPRSSTLLMDELAAAGFLEKKADGSFRMVKDLDSIDGGRTILVPLVGSVTCGIPILAEENIEAMIPVSIALARPGNKYFLLYAQGDSMDMAGISDGDLILVRQQQTADNGDKVVALIDDAATVKEFHHKGGYITLLPRSSNVLHQPIILTDNFRVQGVVIAAIPTTSNY